MMAGALARLQISQVRGWLVWLVLCGLAKPSPKSRRTLGLIACLGNGVTSSVRLMPKSLINVTLRHQEYDTFRVWIKTDPLS
ncbi:hypothetical protein EDB80DRAFT_439084 [Ilyonectria destructans]|nr:hypothetical protein EDB80DRAFT_439084 [Ilyonectria destructans]